MKVRIYKNIKIRKYANTQIRKYANTQIRKYANTQIRKYANTQICKYANMQIRKYANTQIQSQIRKYENSIDYHNVSFFVHDWTIYVSLLRLLSLITYFLRRNFSRRNGAGKNYGTTRFNLGESLQ
jgi:hypothetical protein